MTCDFLGQGVFLLDLYVVLSSRRYHGRKRRVIQSTSSSNSTPKAASSTHADERLGSACTARELYRM